MSAYDQLTEAEKARVDRAVAEEKAKAAKSAFGHLLMHRVKAKTERLAQLLLEERDAE